MLRRKTVDTPSTTAPSGAGRQSSLSRVRFTLMLPRRSSSGHFVFWRTQERSGTLLTQRRYLISR